MNHWKIFRTCVAVLAFSGLAQGQMAQPKFVEWTMVNVNVTDKQGDAHLFKFPDGTIYLLDTGDRVEWILPFLKAHQIQRLDRVIISHMHHDHYGALQGLLEAGIQVKEVIANYPVFEACDSEKPWGCNWQEIQNLKEYLKNGKVPLRSVRAGEVLYQRGPISLRVLYGYDGLHSPFGKTDVNDTSLILRLENGNRSVMLTGDLNDALGRFLALHGGHLRADILKMPHHGAESLAPNEFFDRVNPKVILVPAPASLWKSERTERVRKYIEKSGRPAFVNGIHGAVTVTLGPEAVKVSPEQGNPISLTDIQ